MVDDIEFGNLIQTDPDDECHSALGYARRCIVCGDCCQDSLIDTGEEPPKPVGWVVRRWHWHIWDCPTCQTVSVDPVKFQYDGDGDYVRSGGDDGRVEIAFPYADWPKWEPDQRKAIEAAFSKNLTVDASPDISRELEDIRALILDAQAKIDNAHARISQLSGSQIEVVMAINPVKPIVTYENEPLVFTDEWKAAIQEVLHGTGNLFITGGAGVGKSSLLEHIVSAYPGAIVINAPTGIAALRVNGTTIHSFFRFGAHALRDEDIYLAKDSRRALYKAMDVLVIDEISMVRADLMDAIDKFLRLNGRDAAKPFGGCRLIMFGDLFQLPPVSRDSDEKKWLFERYGTSEPYFFHAECWRDTPLKMIELTTIFRQSDPVFTNALNAIRSGRATDEHLMLINSRVIPNFQPPADELWITLTTTNASADQANRKMLDGLKSEAKVFEAVVSGEFDLKNAPTDVKLELKVGAAVMFIKNHSWRYWVNGTRGKVTSVSPLLVEIDGEEYDVEPEVWSSISYDYDKKTKKLTKHVKGEFEQVPLKLAASITIHKSQGLSLDKVIVDLSSGAFSAGQSYVALSRARTLEGMVLRRPVQTRDLIISTEVQKFMDGHPIARPAENAEPHSVFGPGKSVYTDKKESL